MDPSSGSTSGLREDVDILRQELLKMEAKRDALLKQIEQEEQSIQEADKDQRRMQEIMMAYRLTGVTVFTEDELEPASEINLDLDETPPAGPKQIGIRFETFAHATYQEPYYVMLKTTEPDQENVPPMATGPEDSVSKMTFQISKHTIPHWIPLRDFEKRYLNRDLKAFVARREYINKTIQKLNAAAESMLNLYPEAHTLPVIECRSQDTAIRDVVLLLARYDALFQLTHLYRARTKRESDQARRRRDSFEMDMDVDMDSTTPSAAVTDTNKNLDGEESLLESEKTVLEGMRGLRGSAAFAQIHLIYDDLTSTKPTEVGIKFAHGSERIRIEQLPSGSPMRNQYNHWVKILKTEASLDVALDRIADLYRTDRGDGEN
ncbi:hypothetical protein BGZ83_008353 [Gryganskiella cystojenkinii]|nr:hypothetical protein BGZ83_008353 [Gryganskiella cystojenkinii]